MQVISTYSISHEIHCTSYILYDIIYPILSICITLKPFICIYIYPNISQSIYPNISHNIPFCLPYLPISPYKFPNIQNIIIISLKSKHISHILYPFISQYIPKGLPEIHWSRLHCFPWHPPRQQRDHRMAIRLGVRMEDQHEHRTTATERFIN